MASKMEDIPEENPSEKEEDHEAEEDENEHEEEDEEEEEDDENKTESKKSKKSQEVSQKNSKTSKLLNLNSSKMVIDASTKSSKLAVFSDMVKENSDKTPPSIHYSNKYEKSELSSKKSKISKLSKISKISKNSGLPTFNKIITSDNNQDVNAPSLHYSEKYTKNSQKSSTSIKSDNKSNLPTFNDMMNSDPNQELKPPSVHYSSKYGKNLKKIEKKKVDKNLLTFNEVMNDQNQELNTPSVHYSEKYGKKSLNSIITKSSKNSKLITFNQIATNQNEEQNPPSVHYSEKYQKNSIKSDKKSKNSSNLIMFNEYMNSNRDTKPPSVHYSEKYGKNKKEEEVKNPEKKEKEKIIEKQKEKPLGELITFNDYITYDPEFDLRIQDINYQIRYLYEDEEKKSKISKKSKMSKMSKKSVKFNTTNVEKERVIVIDEKEKENLPKLLCANCHKFPLEPITCSECDNIFCGVCMNGKSKCIKCNSIFKNKPLTEELKHLFSLCKIICKYSPCGCQEQLIPHELLNHEKTCKDKSKKCDNCGEKMNYEKYLKHYKECQLDLGECETCGYKDSVKEYEKTNKKIEHIKHILLPEIENMVKKEIEKAVAAINDSLDQRDAYKEQPENKGNDDISKRLLDIQQLLLNMQPKDYLDRNDDLAKMTKAKYLDRKIKNAKLVLTIPSKIDNAFECNDKYCIVHTFKNDNLILYPNIKYGINCYNLNSSKDMVILPKAFESNITCMASCQNPKKNMSYFASASYDRTIKVYTIEDGFKKLKTYREIFEDYSNFLIDLYCYNNQIILLAGNENLKQIKVLYPEEGDNEKNLMKKMTCKSKIYCLKHNPANEEEFFIGNDEGIMLYNIFNLIGEGDDVNKAIDTEKEYIDKNDEKAKHICITFIEEDNDFFIEGDSIGIVRVWSIKEGELRKKIKRGILKYQINSLDAWSGRTVIGGTKDGKIVIYDIFDGIAVGEVGEHNGYVYCIKNAENWKYEKIVTSCGFDGALKVWASLDN